MVGIQDLRPESSFYVSGQLHYSYPEHQYSVDEDELYGPPDNNEQQEIAGHLTEEQRQRRRELESRTTPLQIEIKKLDKRYTKQGRQYTCEPREEEVIPEQHNWYEKYALCVTRHYEPQDKFVIKSVLQVNSPFLKRTLRKVIGKYPGISFDTKQVSIELPAKCLFLHLRELRHERDKLCAVLLRYELGLEDDDTEKRARNEEYQSLQLLVDFIEEEFKDTNTEVTNLLEQGLITYEHLWVLFKPNTRIHYTNEHPGANDQPSVCESTSVPMYITDPMNPGMHMQTRHVDYDGTRFGWRRSALLIPPFEGSTRITDLNAFPLDRHDNLDEARKTLIARGRKWAHLGAGQNFCEYRGIASDKKGRKFDIGGRVMVDTYTFHRIEADAAYKVTAFDKKKDGNNARPLTDDMYLLATPMVRGFSFTEKNFFDFLVDNLSPVEWNTNCFDQLVLPETKKELVQALVAEHTKRASLLFPSSSSSSSTSPSSSATTVFDDIIQGKGRGLIFVLHGPPGVGKTLTAECVAEFSQRPLYIISSGDLGTNAQTLDQKLARAMDLATTFQAVLLIDEADVFLEQRSLRDVERNGLVSIFLRMLEYYAGILFMTTNRVSTFDEAFKSRIHVPLKYGELDCASRVRIWRTFVQRAAVAGDGGAKEKEEDAASGGLLSAHLTEEEYLELAEHKLNGRQIKGVVRTASSLASYKGVRLDRDLLMQVLEIHVAFEDDFASAGSLAVEDDNLSNAGSLVMEDKDRQLD